MIEPRSAFLYNGEPADLDDWQRSATAADGKTVTEWMSPERTLVLRQTVTEFPGFPVIEVVPELIARGPSPTGLIERFRSVAAAFPLEKEECTLRAVHGARTVPTDFCARSFVLSCRPEENARTFTCGEGRSSSAWMPWFGLDISPQRGWEIAIGWSGAWIAEFEAGSGEVRAAFGMEDSRFRMMPGETFRLPGLLLFQREGMSPMAFQSVIRAFMIRHKSPRDSRGNIIKPCMPVTGSGGNRPSDFHIRLIERFGTGDYPFDTFWIDAGWYGPPRQPDLSENYGRDWPYVVGDWRVNPGSHPRGLRPVAEAARRHGLKFLLWFEPERAGRDVPVLAEHPDYFRGRPGRTGIAAIREHLIDFGNPVAREWLLREVCARIDEIGIDVYRQDFNLDPLPIWRHFDAPDRQGVNEIKHIMGLYAFLDALRTRYPDMLIDNCASGGRRMDYEMTARAHTYCRSDYFFARCPADDPVHNYQILMGQNALINMMAYVPFQSGDSNAVTMFNDYEIFSIAGTGTVLSPYDWNRKIPEENGFDEKETAWLRTRLAQIARLRDILCGQLYWLVPEKTALREDLWAAYQAWDPETGRGAAVFLRRKDDTEPEKTFALREIDRRARYEVEDLNGDRTTVSGEELAQWRVRLPRPQSVSLLFYRPAATTANP